MNMEFRAPVRSLNSETTGDTLAAALAAHGEGSLGQAETLYRRVLVAAPSNVNALHNLGVVGLQTGHPGEAADLFRRAIDADPDFADAYCNLGLALKRTGRMAEAEAAFRDGLSIAPAMAEAHCNLGSVLLEERRFGEASDHLRKAVEIKSDYAEAWSNLGIVYKAQALLDDALDCFQKAVQYAPDIAVLCSNLGAELLDQGDLGAETHLLRALELDPGNAEVNFNLGKARYAAHDLSAAEKYYRRAIAIAPEFADAHHNLAHTLLAQGQLTEGWQQYAWRWKAKKFDHGPRNFPYPEWDGSSLAGKRLLIWSEQGLGDKILFSGLVAELSKSIDGCVVEIDERLVGLFTRSFPKVEIVARTERPDPRIADATFDFQIPLGDLPRYLRRSMTGFQPLRHYLTADDERMGAARRYLNRLAGFNVGISWASLPPKGIGLAEFAPILGLPGINWINLQYGDHQTEIDQVCRRFGTDIQTPPGFDPVNDIDGFAALTASLDAVVTIQNTTLYVAAGLGVPTFAITSPAPDWRWLGCEHDPWHENVRLFKRHGGEDHQNAMQRLFIDFQKFAADLQHGNLADE
ncbi:MAG: tetratricopeptide repeat protein [Rhodospirillales bacterium]|nr:tetratricopeptide repeat protein [Rhodospirillales bacterium]